MSILESFENPSDIKKLSEKELPALAKEIRQIILDTVLENGGHLASSLGAVEIITALHYVFEPPDDKFIFDVGHQCYAHKILTGRKEGFTTLRKEGGISGFPKRDESEYDCFNTGHSSTSISAATGFAKAAELDGRKRNIISLVGDGALTGGLCYEALNFSNSSKVKQIVVLNDNSMSIGKNVGHMAKYLLRLHSNSLYRKAKKGVGDVYKQLSLSSDDKDMLFLAKFKNAIKYFIQSGLPFEQYGYKYFGPIDGHNFSELIQAFRIAAAETDNTIIHVITQKGRGYLEAEQNPNLFHGYSCASANCKGENLSNACGEKLLELAKKDEKIVAVTAAMADGTGLKSFQTKLPERLVDVGIAEAQAVCMSAAMALEGFKPYFAVYSSFLQRAYDQIIHDVALQKAPVRFLIDRAGLVPDDGETHQGIYDVALLRSVPDMVIVAPKDPAELKRVLEWSTEQNFPLAIRYPKGCFENIATKNEDEIAVGKWEVLSEGKEGALLACGALMVKTALAAAASLKKKGIEIGVVNARFIKPLDTALLDRLSGRVFTLEDNQKCGGFGGAVAEYYASRNSKSSIDLKIFAIEEKFLTHAKVDGLLKMCGLDAESIAAKIENEIR